MNLSREFLSQLENRSLKPNLVVVVSPPGQFFTTTESNKPRSNAAYRGSDSFIFWKHEPDTIFDTTEAIFSNHLTRQIGENVPLNCIDSVNISGAEIDLKEASTQDDSVDVNVVLENPRDKSFFQNLIGRNIEIYFGFRDAGYAFEDYERFYVGALRGIFSSSPLSLTLRIGNIADYWNKTWQHSGGMQPTKLAYDYPLNESFQKERDGNLTTLNKSQKDYRGFSFKAEWALRQIATNLTPWGFDYRGPTIVPTNDRSATPSIFFYTSSAATNRANSWKARPEYKLSFRYGKLESFLEAAGGYIRPRSVWLRRYEPFYPTSMFIFQPSGPIDNVIESAPEIVRSRNIYPDTDLGFLRAIRSPEITNRIRFKVGSTVVESEYIDQVATYPFLAGADQITGSGRRAVLTRFEGEGSEKNLVHYVTRGRPVPPSVLNNFFAHFFGRNYPIKFLQFEQPGSIHGASVAANPTPYTLDRQTLVNIYNGPIPRFNFATKLRIFSRKKIERVEFGSNKHDLPKPPEHSAGDTVQFYDLRTGIGPVGDVILDQLRINMGIASAAIDNQSFSEATNNYNVGVGAPPLLRGGYFNSDYSFSGGEDDFKEHLENKILKSNNLRLVSDGGVLRLIYLGLNNLREKQSGDDPFVLAEDDILESTVYETRHEDYVRRLKIRVGFSDLEDEAEFSVFYAHDNRSPDRTQGSIAVFENPPDSINQLDHEEVDLYTNFTLGTPTSGSNSFRDERFGMVGGLFHKQSQFDFRKYVRDFARDYFNVNNPFIRLTVVAGPRAMGIDVGEIIVLRDHQAVEMFGSQFIKVLIVNKSINNWGTESVKVTLDCLFVGKSLDFLEVGDLDHPSNLRLVSKTRNTARPYDVTDATVTWDAPDQWGQDDESIRFYEVVESTPAGERVLFKLPVGSDLSETDSFSWVASTRTLLMNLNNPSTYHIFVRADNGVKKSRASNILSIETFAQSTIPGAPLNLRGRVEDRTAVLSWSAPTDTGNEAQLSYNLYVNGELFLNVGPSLNASYTIEGSDAESISFYVTAENSRGEGPPSNTVTLDVDAVRPVPTGTIELNTIENGTSAIRLFISHELQNADQLEINRDGVLIRTIDVGASPQNFEDIGLESNTRYCYRVIAVNSTGAGAQSNESCSTTLQETIDAVPGPVQLLRTTDVATNEIDISWLAPLSEGSSPITHYNVCWSTDNISFTCVNETDVDHEFTNLTPGTVYYLRVSAVNAVGEGQRELLIVNTLGASLVPTKPVITASQTEYDSPFQVDVTLNLPNLTSDVITSYVIERSTDNVTFASVSTNNSPSSTNTYNDRTGLVDGTTYYYRARTTNSVGNSAYSDVVSVEIVDCEKREAVVSNINVRFKDATAEQKQLGSWVLHDRTMDVDDEGTDDPCGSYEFDDPEDLSSVRNLRLVSRAQTTAEIAWDIPRFLGGHAIARYDVQLGGVTRAVTSTATTLQNLTPNTSYTVRVRPVNTFGTTGPWFSLIFSTLALPPPPPRTPPGKPTNLRIQTSHSTIDKTFVWDAPSNLGTPPLTDYVLRLNGSDYNTSSTNTSLRIRNLLYATNYTAQVAAINANGMGEFSDAFTFSIGDGIPAPPRNLFLRLVNETSVNVSWDAPLVTNGSITNYTIYYRELQSGAAWEDVDVSAVPVDDRLNKTIDGFMRGKTYEFDMTASTSGGESLTTNNPVQITIPSYEAPGAVGINCDPIPLPPE